MKKEILAKSKNNYESPMIPSEKIETPISYKRRKSYPRTSEIKKQSLLVNGSYFF